MSKQEEIIEVAGKKVVVRYTKDNPCHECSFFELCWKKSKDVHEMCWKYRPQRVEEGCELSYFVEVERPEEEAPARPANPLVPDQCLTIDGKRYVKRYFRIGDACSRCAFKVGEDAKGHAFCKDHGKLEKPCTPDREKGVLVYFIAADQLQEEIHSLPEWAKIMAERPDLRAEFDKMCPPQPIQGSIAPEADLEAEAERFFKKFPMRANTPGVPDEYLDFETYMLIARHFAEWGVKRFREQIAAELAKFKWGPMKHLKK